MSIDVDERLDIIIAGGYTEKINQNEVGQLLNSEGVEQTTTSTINSFIHVYPMASGSYSHDQNFLIDYDVGFMALLNDVSILEYDDDQV